MKQLVTTDNQRDRSTVVALSSMGNMVTEKLQQMFMGNKGDELNLFVFNEESAILATMESKSSEEKPAHRGRKMKTRSSGEYHRTALLEAPERAVRSWRPAM